MTDEKPPSSRTVLPRTPFVVMAVIAIMDVLAGPGVGLLPLVAVGPAFAGPVGGRRRTAAIGVLALPLGPAAHGTEGPEPFTVAFGPGEHLLLYTDGVTEARDEEGRFCPLGGRTRLLKEPGMHRAFDALREDLVRHAGGPPPVTTPRCSCCVTTGTATGTPPHGG